MGFICPERQTTADFLTSLTSPAERTIREGFEDRVPNTPDEFVEAWKKSAAYAQLKLDIEAYDKKFPIGGEALDRFIASRKAQQAKGQRVKSPYTLSLMGQVRLCMRRGFDRLKGDATLTLSGLFGNSVMGLIIGKYNLRGILDDNSYYRSSSRVYPFSPNNILTVP